MGTDIVTYQLKQRDHLLQVARAMSARLEPREVLSVVVRSAVRMTGGRAGAIAIREDRADGLFEGDQAPRLERSEGPPLRIVASYHLEERFVDYVGDAVRTPVGAETASYEDAAHDTGQADEPYAPATGASLTRWYQDDPLGTVADDADGPRRVLTLPLELRGETIGQIVVLRDETATLFSPLDDDLLRAFADQAAIAIQNAILHGRLRRRERQLAAVVQDSAAGILLLDATGQAVTINPAAANFLGQSSEMIVGRAVGELIRLQDESGRPVQIVLPNVAEGTITPRGRLSTGLQREERWVQVSVTPQLHEEGDVEGYVVAMTDLTAWREAERTKSAFLAGLSHELKTPLSLIRGFTETLANPEMSHEDGFHQQAFGVILDETARLTEIVDQLLLAARLQAGAFKLQLDIVDVGALLTRLIAELRLTAPGRAIALDARNDVPTITADEGRLREVFAELIRNAVKYAPPDVPIQVSAVRDERAGPGGVVIAVIDGGPTIPSVERDRIFERFYRGAEHGEGTGLGLYMARAIARAHGGDVDVASVPGEGNAFVVHLPSAPPAEADRTEESLE